MLMQHFPFLRQSQSRTNILRHRQPRRQGAGQGRALSLSWGLRATSPTLHTEEMGAEGPRQAVFEPLQLPGTAKSLSDSCLFNPTPQFWGK